MAEKKKAKPVKPVKTVKKYTVKKVAPKKEERPRIQEIPIVTLSPEDAKRELEKFMKGLEDEYKNVPDELIEVGAGRFLDFLNGKLSWADIFCFPPSMLQQIAELGYIKYQAGRYDEAERFFKVLTVLDWENYFYHSMMGLILAQEKRLGEAIASYTVAIGLNPEDAMSLVGRGEIFLETNFLIDAERDIDAALKAAPKSKWAERAVALKARLEQIKKAAAATKQKGERP